MGQQPPIRWHQPVDEGESPLVPHTPPLQLHLEVRLPGGHRLLALFHLIQIQIQMSSLPSFTFTTSTLALTLASSFGWTTNLESKKHSHQRQATSSHLDLTASWLGFLRAAMSALSKFTSSKVDWIPIFNLFRTILTKHKFSEGHSMVFHRNNIRKHRHIYVCTKKQKLKNFDAEHFPVQGCSVTIFTFCYLNVKA